MQTSCSEFLWLGINTETWAIVLATFLGPVAAIIVARWREAVTETRMRRFQIFRTLLATRRQAITKDHVASLNLIEIDFYGIGPIEAAWRDYQGHLNSPPKDRPMTPSEGEQFEGARNDLLAKLIFAIAKFLKFNMSELDIRNGGYAPDGWRLREEREIKVQDFFVDMGTGRRGLPVFPFNKDENQNVK